MGTFGERLQREREMRGITLEEIAEATKIGTRSLRALEEQDFDKLPGGIFNKGFVRAYSKYLGIDEDQAVADYQAAVSEAQQSGKLTRPEYTAPLIEDAEEREPVRVPWGVLILISLIVAVGFAARSYYAQHGLAKLRRQPMSAKPAQIAPASDAQQAVAPAVTTPNPPSATDDTQKDATVASNSSTPSKSTPSKPTLNQPPKADPAVTAAAPVDRFVVKVHATELSWVSIKADGKTVVEEIMQPNADHQVHAAKEIVVVTGNAAGIELSHNDKLLPAIGEEGQKKTIILTAQGVQPQ